MDLGNASKKYRTDSETLLKSVKYDNTQAILLLSLFFLTLNDKSAILFDFFFFFSFVATLTAVPLSFFLSAFLFFLAGPSASSLLGFYVDRE